MFFEKDFPIQLDQLYYARVEGYLDEDEVTGYLYSHITEVILEDGDGNPVTEDDEDYPELMMFVHEKDYEPDDWSEL